MTMDEAQIEAKRRWGPNGAAWKNHLGGYDVGIILHPPGWTSKMGELKTLYGWGDSLEAAFSHSDKNPTRKIGELEK